MDKSKLIRLILIPVAMGLIVTVLVGRYAPAVTQNTNATIADTVPVVVITAKERIPARTPVTQAQLGVKQVPRELLTGGEFTAVAEAAGQIAMVDLQPGEVLLKSRVVPEGEGALPYRIPKGMRAIAVRADELSAVAGYPEVGDLVDLILFLPSREKNGVKAPASSRILYESVQILAKGPDLSAKAAGADAPKLTSYTVALSPEAATEVALAEQIGYIKMVLRPALKEPEAGQITIDENRYLPGAAPAQPKR